MQKAGVLSNTELLDDLKVKRSSLVIALLAQFPDVVVRSSEPVVVQLIKRLCDLTSAHPHMNPESVPPSG